MWEALAFLDSFRSHGESGDPFSDAGPREDRIAAFRDWFDQYHELPPLVG